MALSSFAFGEEESLTLVCTCIGNDSDSIVERVEKSYNWRLLTLGLALCWREGLRQVNL